MADTIVCQACGEVNPADMEFCQNCQSRLRPLTGALKAENNPIQPGQLPTKKVTSELEPLLPQWLRDARQQAREAAAEDASKEKEEKPAPSAPGSDLLAGLESQGRDEDEEVPDWVAHITGASPKKKKPVPEESQVKWVELGHGEEAQTAPLREPPGGIAAQPTPSREAQPERPAKEDLSEWFKEASAASGATDFQLPPAPPESAIAPFGPAQASPEAPVPQQPVPPPPAEDLGWLKNLESAAAERQEQPQPAPPPRADVPDWLKKLQDQQNQPQEPQAAAPAAAAAPSEVPDWLKTFAEAAPAPVPIEPQAAEPEEPLLSESALPDWLRANEPQAIEPPLTAATSAPIPPEAEPTLPAGELPDWISSLGKPSGAPEASAPPATPALSAGVPPVEAPASGAVFTQGEGASSDVDAIFASMQTPDWLSGVAPSAPAAEEKLPPAAQVEQPIGPADLPSWVQAMRPVESAMAPGAGAAAETMPEELGALAGLQGVLPAIPGGAAPSSKPRSHSIKLDATEQQQTQAALLEQILVAETSPIPMRSTSVIRSQKLLRWAIGLLVLVVLGSAVFTGSQNMPLPSGVPNETIAAIKTVEAVPADAPVLVIFDYQPSTVGEMEASGASLLDHLLLLKHPRLALLSTSPTGSALAERFMSAVLADRSYARDVQYVDLGYLPGGLTGIYNFAQNPTAAVPLDAGSKPVWQSPVLAPVTRFSDFAAVIVLTDSVEAGRSWIEQTSLARGSSQMVIVASAQAGPMLLPYVDSGQVNGLVSGVNGAAGAEQANGGMPGYVRRYWDAYSLGLYLAAALIVLGGLWNLWLGLRDRGAQAVA